MQKSSRPSHRRRGIYLLPNLFTTAALFAGFFAVVAAMNGRFENAAVAIFIAMILDGIDGRVARLTNTQSEFGAEYDSLSDMVSFGVAPSLVMYEWSLSSLVAQGPIWGKLAWLGAFVYVACAALRLARFNVQVDTADKRYFLGLPSPAAAATVVGMVWFCTEAGIRGEDVALYALILTTFIGLLMVSNFFFYSFKEVNFRGKVPFMVLLLVVLIFAFASIDPPTILFVVFFLYSLSGPVFSLVRRVRKVNSRGRKLKSSSPDEAGKDTGK